MKNLFFIELVLAVLLLAPSLAFAEKNKAADTAKSQFEPVAVVNGKKITREEVIAALEDSLSSADSDTQRSAKKNFLNTKINQILISQEIAKNKSQLNDKDHLRLEYLKNQAEFNFYLNKLVGDIPKPSDRLVDEYITKNPKYFADRKLYHYAEYLIDNSNLDTMKLVKSAGDQGEVIGGLSSVLSKQKINYARTNYWYGVDQIDQQKLSVLESMKTNGVHIGLSSDGKFIEVIYLYGVYDDPIYIDDARSVVQLKSVNVYASKKAKAILASLRAKADIEVSDEFLEETSGGDENIKSADLSAYQANVSISSWAVAAWNLALLVLVPVCVIGLYRQIIARKKEQEFRLDAPVVSAPHSLLVLNDMRIPILILLPIALFTPLFLFLSDLPVWMTRLRFLSSFLMGIGFGFGLVVMIWKLKPLNYLFQNKWVGVLGLLAIDLGLLLTK
jgi:EpsD family peptidyl-prolyl cis-trans isomerase